VADRQQAVAALNDLAYVRQACLTVVDAGEIGGRLVDHRLGGGDHRYRQPHFLGQSHDVPCAAEPVRVQIHQDGRCFGLRQAARGGGGVLGRGRGGRGGGGGPPAAVRGGGGFPPARGGLWGPGCKGGG